MITLNQKLTNEYLNLFKTCHINADKMDSADKICNKFLANKDVYNSIGIVPWYIVAVIHQLESSCNFKTHLHNGDPLTERTRNVPIGRPKTGTPPFSWEFSAKDALKDKMIPEIWNIENCLYFLEAYNGFGYRLYHPEIVSPYLWGQSNHHIRGKYTSDGKFSPTAKTSQIGAAVLLKYMFEKGLFQFETTNELVSSISIEKNETTVKPKKMTWAELFNYCINILRKK